MQRIGAEWGGEQVVIGPVLLVPITERWTTLETVVSGDGDAKQIRRDETRDDVITVLPETLRIDATLDAERRRRGIYEAMVYASRIVLAGRFATPDIATPVGRSIDVHWDDATLAVGVSAPVGIHNVEMPLIAGGARAAEPGSLLPSLPQGMHWRLRDAKTLADNGNFSIEMSLHGSAQIAFAPVGATTQVQIVSAWPHPGFTGVMPTQRKISGDGFDASWSVSSLSRNYPQVFAQSNAPAPLNQVGFGVRLVQPVFLYSLNDRAEYAVLFIPRVRDAAGVRVGDRGALHYDVQYADRRSMTLFYLLLLALSERRIRRAPRDSRVDRRGDDYGLCRGRAFRAGGALLVGAMQAVPRCSVVLQLEDYALVLELWRCC